jgi:hypothetical protein
MPNSESYTLKEMVTKVLEQNEKALVVQTELLGHAQKMDEVIVDIKKDASKNTTDITDLQTEHTQVKAYAVAISALFGFVITGVNLFLK